jgi:hypothetical protein
LPSLTTTAVADAKELAEAGQRDIEGAARTDVVRIGPHCIDQPVSRNIATTERDQYLQEIEQLFLRLAVEVIG